MWTQWKGRVTSYCRDENSFDTWKGLRDPQASEDNTFTTAGLDQEVFHMPCCQVWFYTLGNGKPLMDAF